MKIETQRWGEVEVAPDDLLTFPDGLPGFEDKRFALVPAPSASKVLWLQAVGTPALALMTVDPNALGMTYSPRFKPAETRVVGGDREDATLECRVIAEVTAGAQVRLNLFAPLLINRAAGLAAQLPLVGSGFETQTPWPSAGPSDTVPGP